MFSFLLDFFLYFQEMFSHKYLFISKFVFVCLNEDKKKMREKGKKKRNTYNKSICKYVNTILISWVINAITMKPSCRIGRWICTKFNTQMKWWTWMCNWICIFGTHCRWTLGKQRRNKKFWTKIQIKHPFSKISLITAIHSDMYVNMYKADYKR